MIKLRLSTLALIAIFAASPVLADEWVAKPHPMGPGWIATNGDHTINAPDKKSAEKVAKNMNKADKKGSKGFKSEDSGPCADPSSGVRC